MPYLIWIATEACDILTCPFHRKSHVEKPEVECPFCLCLLAGWEAEEVQSVVDADPHYWHPYLDRRLDELGAVLLRRSTSVEIAPT